MTRKENITLLKAWLAKQKEKPKKPKK